MPKYMAALVTCRRHRPARERTPKWELNDEASTGSPKLPQRAPQNRPDPGPLTA
ncbi:UNVERIFIED_CONTAM: hypothetical protein Sradi_2107900 [Sesamum radiatum]|uniref:Uncharacterized protein n=1 Tax=Sesamum radiatum TaxID=300843 RepID=A0AAW2TM11_SESRA